MQTTARPDIGACLQEGWTLYSKAPWLLSAATVLAVVINLLASWIPFANVLTSLPLLAGLYILIKRVDTGLPADIGQLFDGFQRFLPLVLASVLTSALITLGLLLFVLPGLYLGLAYGFTALMIVDRDLDFWPAMEASRKLITANFWRYLLLALLLAGICIVAAIPFGLGLLVAVPVCLAAQYRFYRAISPMPVETDID